MYDYSCLFAEILGKKNVGDIGSSCNYSFNCRHKTNSFLIRDAKHPKMSTQEGEDIEKPFIEKEWIRRGRIYDTKTNPTFVNLARSKATEIPQNITSTQLPKTNLSISEFLSCELPRVSSELISSKTSLWFNPSIQFLCLLDTCVPSDQALPYIEVTSDMDMERFKALKEGKIQLISALKLSRKRGGV